MPSFNRILKATHESPLLRICRRPFSNLCKHRRLQDRGVDPDAPQYQEETLANFSGEGMRASGESQPVPEH